MPKSMRPVIKVEDGEEGGQEAEGRQEEAGVGRAVQQRRRLGEAGDAAWDEVQMLRLNMELQAQAIQGMEQTRLLGEELLQAKARAAELKNTAEALQSIIQSKDSVIQSKDALLQSQTREMQTKDLLLQAKDAVLQAKDSELRLLHADNARLSAQPAVGGAARQPAPAPAAQGDAAARRNSVAALQVSSLPRPPVNSFRNAIHQGAKRLSAWQTPRLQAECLVFGGERARTVRCHQFS